MKEAQRIFNLLNTRYNGEAWIDINMLDNIKHLSVKQAVKKHALQRLNFGNISKYYFLQSQQYSK
jgi:hypothetical protein